VNAMLNLVIVALLALSAWIVRDAYAYEQTNKHGKPVEIHAHVMTFGEVARYCRRQLPGLSLRDTVQGCAFFSWDLSWCSIYVPDSMLWIRKHEERHCREGRFHD